MKEPFVEILSHENGDYVTGIVQIGGTFGDDAEVRELAVSLDGGETLTAIEGLDFSIEEWSYDLDNSGLPDGDKDVRLRITDGADKTAEKRLLLYFDNNAPVVLIKNPSGYASEEFNDDVTVRGEASDELGIAVVEIELFDGSGNAVPLFDSDGNLTSSNSTNVDGTNSWSFQFESRYYTLASGSYSFVVTSIDRAGNANEYVYHDDDIRSLSGGSAVNVESLYVLDKGVSVEGLAISLEQLSSARLERMEMSVDQSLDIPVIEFSVPTVGNNSLGDGANAIGTVRDDDGIDTSSIQIRFDSSDDADWVPVTSTTGSGISVSWEHDLSSLAQGNHTVELSVLDINGLQAASSPLSFLIDSGAPLVSIDAPSAGAYLNADFTISGTASDAVGVGSVEVSIGNSGTFNPVTSFDSSTWTTTSQTNVWTWSHDFTVEGDLSTEGTQQFRVRATDTSGKSTAENLQVFADSLPPVVTFLGIASGETVNGEILVQGTTQNVSPINQLSLDVDGGSAVYVLDSGVNELDADPSTSAASSVYR